MDNLVTTALKLIKILQNRYALPVDIGSKIILKVSDNSPSYLNWHVFNHLYKALTLKLKYDMLDPELMLQDSEYLTYGPVGI